MKDNWRIETKMIQSGYEPDNGEPRVLPIVQSTTYTYDSTDHVAQLFDLAVPGHMYSRISNPTVEALESKIAALEGGVAALCTSSGQSASMVSVLNVCEAGEHIVALNCIYGGTYNLFAVTLKKMGVSVTFIDAEASVDQIQAAIQDNTKAIFGETITNPSLRVMDIEKFAKVAHENGIPLIVDNTFPTPYLCRPFEHGADIVVHSATKYLDGHATSVGGVIVDSGNFDWTNGKFPGFTNPDPSYHGLVYTEAFGKSAYIVKGRVQFIRDIGNCLSPMNAFLINLGTETLHLRMERHCENALELAQFLEKHPKIAQVEYPGLPTNSQYELAQKYLPKGASGVVSFEIDGDREAAARFQDHLELAKIVVHVADVRTSVLNPATATHRQLSDQELKAAGISPGLVRISVGVENIEDIIADIERALSHV